MQPVSPKRWNLSTKQHGVKIQEDRHINIDRLQDDKPGMVSPPGDGFGGLAVSMLASGSRVRGFDPDRSRWIFFRCEKILSMPSFGGEVK
jgi:hypothetical protein